MENGEVLHIREICIQNAEHNRFLSKLRQSNVLFPDLNLVLAEVRHKLAQTRQKSRHPGNSTSTSGKVDALPKLGISSGRCYKITVWDEDICMTIFIFGA